MFSTFSSSSLKNEGLRIATERWDNHAAITAKVKQVISLELCVQLKDLTKNTHFRDDLNLGYIGLMQLYLKLERAFRISLYADGLMTVGQVVEYIYKKLNHGK